MTERPWTLRDMRRVLARYANRASYVADGRRFAIRDGMARGNIEVCVRVWPMARARSLDAALAQAGILPCAVSMDDLGPDDQRAVYRALDALIGRYGPDQRAEDQKGGDAHERDEAPRQPVGVGMPGDVDAEDVDEIDTAVSGARGSRTDGGAQEGPQAGAVCGSDEETAGEETSPTATSPAHPPAADPDVDAEHSCDDASDCGLAETDRDASPYGGGGGDPRRDAGATPPSLAYVREVMAVVRAIGRLAALARRAEPAPRWDGRRVVHELVSRQLRTHRMRQDAPALRAALILYDVSGSCAWVADQTAAIATWVAARDPRILVAPTGDRYPEGKIIRDEIRGRSAVLRAIQRLAPELIAEQGDYRALVRAGVSHMLVLGDAHGHYGYRCAAQAGIDVRWVNPNPDIAPDDWHHGAYALCDERTVIDAMIAVCTTRP